MKPTYLIIALFVIIGIIIISTILCSQNDDSGGGCGSGIQQYVTPVHIPTFKSSCFDTSIQVGLPITEQMNHTFPVMGSDGQTYNTSVQVVNGGNQDIWINWLASDSSSYSGKYPGPVGSADGYFTKTLEAALETPMACSGSYKSEHWSWQNDPTHPEGMFKLPKGKYVILPYFGKSVRFAGALGCSPTPSNGVNCKVGRGGTPSPQTLIEWTWTPAGPDVIDSSFVDGYALPVRIEYLTGKGDFKTILGTANRNSCTHGGKEIITSDGKYAGCQSPCSAGVNGVKGVDNKQILTQVCCTGKYDKPCTCHPCVGLTGKKLDDCINNRGGWCEGGIAVADDILTPWCDSVTTMFNVDGKRLGYCYAYDDSAGSITDQEKKNSIVKIVMCTDEFDDFTY